jgi:hypothetical protein
MVRIVSELPTAVRQIRRRYGARDRQGEYAGLLGAAGDAGFELMSLAGFHARSSLDRAPRGRWLALRHDVDICDPVGNEAFRAIEVEAGARSTFYFRWSTVGAHERLIQRLLQDRFEVGYHFEEAATVAKRRGLASRPAVEARRDEIADLMRHNCATFRERWNPDLQSIASHGDWANRRLGFANNEFVTPELLAACGLQFEAYGDEILGRVAAYVSDVATPPQVWTGGYGLIDALRDERAPICLLTHERRWHTNRRASATADFDRLRDEIVYRWRRRRARRSPSVIGPEADTA